jgi:hypothetical protein
MPLRLSMRFRGCVAVFVGMHLALGMLWGQQASPPVFYVGGTIGGGMSNLVNQNTFGFPKMSYRPEVVTRYGFQAGVAFRPWSKVQLGIERYQVRYNFRDTYASMSTIPQAELQKMVGMQLLTLSLTYRQHWIPRELSSVGTLKTIELELKKRHGFFLFGGPQFSLIRQAEVAFQMRTPGNENSWREVDIPEVKLLFDQYVPVDEIPNQLPEDARDLYTKGIFSLMGGVGWQMNLAPGFSATLEVSGSLSLNDFNSRERDGDGRYLWRRQVYSASNPKGYFQSTIYFMTVGANLYYSF